MLLAALSHVANAKGMTQVAKDAEPGRESLRKALLPCARPRFETINAVLRAQNLRMAVVAGCWALISLRDFVTAQTW